jgi:hypothetical protein
LGGSFQNSVCQYFREKFNGMQIAKGRFGKKSNFKILTLGYPLSAIYKLTPTIVAD